MYEWLLDYQKQSDEIDYLEYKLYREKRELKRWTEGDLYKVKMAEGAIAANLEERIAAYEIELAHKMNDLFNAKKLIATFKGLENQILYYRYVEGMLLEEIAEELNYSSSYIYKKHAEMMKMIRFADSLSI